MAGNYEKGIYNQLMEVMARLDAVEKELHIEKTEHKEDVDRLNIKIENLAKENQELRNENQLLRDDNARLKSIINNDSSNTSLPPSTDQKGGKPSNTYNGRKNTNRKNGGQKGHKGITLTKSEVEEKIKSGKCKLEIRNLGDISSGKYITKYVIDLSIAPLITEVHIYADEKGHYNINVVNLRKNTFYFKMYYSVSLHFYWLYVWEVRYRVHSAFHCASMRKWKARLLLHARTNPISNFLDMLQSNP